LVLLSTLARLLVLLARLLLLAAALLAAALAGLLVLLAALVRILILVRHDVRVSSFDCWAVARMETEARARSFRPAPRQSSPQRNTNEQTTPLPPFEHAGSVTIHSSLALRGKEWWQEMSH
jgi:hypothetical protein